MEHEYRSLLAFHATVRVYFLINMLSKLSVQHVWMPVDLICQELKDLYK